MSDFRKIKPFRRDNAPQGKVYKAYKPLLREDFHQRCGYCGDHEFFRESFYEIDHFVPKALAPEKENEYSNLIYSCRSCNNSKRDKWPTGDVTQPHDGKEGWIDPCDEQYSLQFERLEDGSIKSKTELGLWMWKSLSFGNPMHRLKWTLEQIRVELNQAQTVDISDVSELRQINELNTKYRQFEEQLRGFPNFD